MRIKLQDTTQLTQAVAVGGTHKLTLQKENNAISIRLLTGEEVTRVPVGTFDTEWGYNLFDRRASYQALVEEDGALHVIRYAPLHGHSGYSMLDGASHIHDMVAVAEDAIALTDHGNMFGTLDFYKKAKKAGKKPIIGCELYTETRHGEKKGNHLLVLAETTTGYHNLVKLVSRSYENRYRKPHVTYEWLEELKEGLIVTSACLGGEVSQALIAEDMTEARAVVSEMVSIFGKDHYFIEIQRHGIDEEETVNPGLQALATEFDLKMIATADSHYTHEEDRESQEILLCISTKKTMDDPDRMKFDGGGYHIHSSVEMAELFWDMPEVLDNTLDIAERCNVEIEMGKNYLPHFDVPAPFTSDKDYFVHLCKQGFERRFGGTVKMTDSEYLERLDYEMSVINKMGFPGYFLIMWDVIRFAQENNILVGPGRGSACGSLVAYVLNITDVDPIEFGLLFERFLNEDRYSMPDIDTDFSDVRREEVIAYCREKYGEKSVARIMTVTRLTAKSVVRDVTRVMGYPYALGNKLSNAIPTEPGMTLAKAMQDSVEFKELYATNEDAKRIIDLSFKLENTPKTTGIHACGVVISSGPVDDRVPTFLTEDKETKQMVLTTQYDKDQNEECGLLKMDFLGLRTMGVMDEAVRLTNESRQASNESPLTMSIIPTDNVETYQHIARGHTAGVFQLEQPGMTKFMKQLFNDAENVATATSDEFYNRLFAGISLYRPGPMDEIPNYLANMMDENNVTYDTPELEPILKNTYGTIVYQEQCMQIVRDLAGFSRGQSDIIRKGMAKKQIDLLNEYEPAFLFGSKEFNIEGCVPRGISEDAARTIWDKMLKFSKYAFNKSHAVGYAYVSVKTGWLATHYPVEFFTATMNSFISKNDKIKKYISVAKKQGIQVVPPNINKSREYFTVDGDAIRFGLKGIKSVGKTSAAIIREREERGIFTDMRQFIVRMSVHEGISSGVIESLIFSGALDIFPGTRKEKILRMDDYLGLARFIRDAKRSRKATLFNLPGTFDADPFQITLAGTNELDSEMRLEKEKEFAGFYITGHPLTAYRKSLKQANYIPLSELTDMMEEKMELNNVDTLDIKGTFAIAGVISEEVDTFYTKRTGEPLKVFKLEDESGEISCTVFSSLIARNSGLFEKGQLLYLEGHASVDGGEMRFTANDARDLHHMRQHDHPESFLIVGHKDVGTARKQYRDILALARNHKEIDLKIKRPRIKLYFQQDGKVFDMNVTVPYSPQNQRDLENIVGKRGLQPQYAS